MYGIVRFSWWSLRGHWDRVGMLCIGLLCISLCTTLLAGFTQLSTLTATRQVSRSWRTTYDLLVRTPNSLSPAEQQLHIVDPSAPEQTYGGISLAQLNTITHIVHVAVVAPEAVVGWITLRPYLPLIFPQGVYRVTTDLRENVTGIHTSTTHFYIVVPLATYTQLAATQTSPDTSYIPLEASGSATVAATWQLQTLLAGIDPNAESQLVNLHWHPATRQGTSSVPLLMNTHAWTPLTATVMVEQAQLPSDITTFQTRNAPSNWTPVMQRVFDGSELLALLAHELGTRTQESFAPLQGGDVTRYARVDYMQSQQAQLTLQSVGSDTAGSLTRFPLLPQATTPWLALDSGTNSFSTFDATQLASQYENSSVPLGLYQPVLSSTSPGLSPTHAVTSWPPLLLTTLAAACQLTGQHCISAIRVRVADLGSFGQRSESLLQQVAMDIQGRTGLHVDVITGSSGHPLTIQTTVSDSGTISEVWVQPYAAVTITSGVNIANILLLIAAVSVALLALIAAALLSANGRVSDVRLLLDTGWSRPLLLSEATIEAGVAALLAALPAWLVSLLLTRLGAPPVPIMAVIVALTVAFVLYVIVVLIATQAMVSIRKRSVWRERLLWLRGSWWWMMFRRQASWRRGSTALVVIAMMGACGLVCFMLLVQTAIDGILYATLLGREVQVGLSTTHTFAALLTCISAVLTASLTLLLVMRERLPEFSTLLAIGWTRRNIAFEIVRESMLLGLLGGLLGGFVAEICFVALYHVWSWQLFTYIAMAGVLGAILCVCSAIYPTLVTLWLLSRRVLVES